MVNRVLEIIIGILLITTISHLLSVEQMGQYQYFNALNSLVMTVVFFWIMLCVVRFFDLYELNGKLHEFYKAMRVFVFWASVVVIFFFGIYGVLTDQLLVASLLGGGMIIHSIRGIIVGIQRARHQSIKFAVNSMVGVLTKFILIVFALTQIENNYVLIFVSIIISSLLIVIINFDQFLEIFIKGHSETKPIYMELVKIGIPLAIVSSVELLLSLSDRFVIDYYFSKVEVGLYSNIYGFASYVFQSILSVFMSGMGPIAIKAWNRDQKGEVNTILNRNYYYYLMVAIPALFGLQIVRSEFVEVMLGAEYLVTVDLLLPISISYLMINSIIFAQKGIEYSNQIHYLIKYGMLATALNLGLNLVFLEDFGYKFAAISTVISYLVFFLIILKVGRQFVQMELRLKSLSQYLLASVAMYVIVSFIGIEGSVVFRMIVKAGIGVVIYVAALVLMNIRHLSDLNIRRG